MMLNSLGGDDWAAMETISWNSFDNTNVFSAFFVFDRDYQSDAEQGCPRAWKN